jgi:hypothetical protein
VLFKKKLGKLTIDFLVKYIYFLSVDSLTAPSTTFWASQTQTLKGMPFLWTIDGHNRLWIDGSVPKVSIDTFGLIFIDVIDPSIKDFFIFD